MRVSRSFSDIGCLKVLYYAYVRSILEYCSSIWNPSYVTYTQAIESIQSKFIKHLNFRSNCTFVDYNEACNHHHLMTLQNRRTLADMSFLHGICNGYLDCGELSSKVLCFCVPKIRTRQTNLFAAPHTSTNYAQNSIISRLHNSYNKRFGSTDIFNDGREAFRREVLKMLHENF